jgi:hypothetical protein
MTKYLPHPEMNNIHKKRSAELRKHHCYSTWYYDEYDNDIVICTTLPGLWIGRRGEDVADLKEKINEVAIKHHRDPVKISFIECDS